MNLSGLLSVFDGLPAYGRLTDRVALRATASTPTALQLPSSARPPVLARLSAEISHPILFVTGRVEAVPIWQQLLEAWLPPGRRVVRFPEPTPLPYDRGPWSDNSRLGRLQVLTRLMAGQHPLLPPDTSPPIIITSARALLHKTLPKRRFMNALRVFKIGQIIELDKLLATWTEIGYERVAVVESPGHFSQRGGIIDIFPAAAPYPVRIELFGDEIDTLRFFDPSTQRTVAQEVQRVIVPPAREVLPLDAADVALDWLDADLEKDDDLPSWHDDIPDLLSGEASPHMEYYLPLIYTQPASLLDYLPSDSVIFVDDWAELQAAVRDLAGQAAKMRGDQPTMPPDYPSPLWEWTLFADKLSAETPVVLGDLTEDAPLETHDPATLAELLQNGPRYGGQTRPLMNHLQRTRDIGERTVIVSRQAQRLAELWRLETRQSAIFEENGLAVPVENVLTLPHDGSLTFVQGSLSEGFVLTRDDAEGSVLLNFFTDAEIFGWQRPTPRRRREARALAPETYFSDIEAGDYVVHIEYGVGQFMGLVTRQIGGERREYLQLRYTNDDMLYVPVHHADRLSKWVGPEERAPDLHRLGDKRWGAAKAKAQKAVNDLADELLELYAAREAISGHAFSADTEWQAELEASFPYLETEDQIKAIADVKRNMEHAQPMDRLICGDVGYGKTEVALRAAFKAVMDSKQVAILVPTTVLAQQHYQTFSQRLEPFPVNVEQLSRLRTPSQQARTLQGMRDGSVDIVIGTHRLLSKDVGYKDLGLLIIDEEQRFGVSHKEMLKQLRTEVDVLTMTATPIPRTLYMGLSGMRDISLIQTPPAERLPVQTYVGRSDETLIRKAILREMDRGGQVFFVHNRVQTIGAIKRQLEKLVPEARVVIGHGQMGERALEAAMAQFAAGEVDILLSTTIIESGLDIPNANTLIVDRAELFGLSQLYQLRGRVGRAAQRAYAYFFHAAWRSLGADAQARLDTIAENTHLGAGYDIAMRDLEIRGAGELLGDQQSGHISSVGFDLYTRMLAHAVKARKAAVRGESLPPELSEGTLIDLPLPTYVPEDYVPDAPLRLRLYRRMAGLASLAEIDGMAEELADRFGPIPDPVDNLLYQLRIKVLAAAANVMSVTTENKQIQLKVPTLEGTPQYLVQRYLGEGVRVSRTSVWFSAETGTHSWRVKLVQILEKLAALDPEKLGAQRAP